MGSGAGVGVLVAATAGLTGTTYRPLVPDASRPTTTMLSRVGEMMASSTLSPALIRATWAASKDGWAASQESAASGQTSSTPAVRTSKLPSALRARTAMSSVVMAMAVGAGEPPGGGTARSR